MVYVYSKLFRTKEVVDIVLLWDVDLSVFVEESNVSL